MRPMFAFATYTWGLAAGQRATRNAGFAADARNAQRNASTLKAERAQNAAANADARNASRCMQRGYFQDAKNVDGATQMEQRRCSNVDARNVNETQQRTPT